MLATIFYFAIFATLLFCRIEPFPMLSFAQATRTLSYLTYVCTCVCKKSITCTFNDRFTLAHAKVKLCLAVPLRVKMAQVWSGDQATYNGTKLGVALAYLLWTFRRLIIYKYFNFIIFVYYSNLIICVQCLAECVKLTCNTGMKINGKRVVKNKTKKQKIIFQKPCKKQMEGCIWYLFNAINYFLQQFLQNVLNWHVTIK